MTVLSTFAFASSLSVFQTRFFVTSSLPVSLRTMASSSSTKPREHNRPRQGRGRRPRQGKNWFSSAPKARSSNPFEGPELLKPVPEILPPETIAVVWLRNDLRIPDHAALKLAGTAELMAPVFVFDLTKFGRRNKSPWRFPRCGPFRADFLKQSVKELTFEMRKRGSDVYIRLGKPVEEVLSIVRDIAEALKKRVVVVAHKETTWEEVTDEQSIEEGVRKISEELELPMDVHWLWTSTLHHPKDLPFNPAGRSVPPTFTAYRKLVEAGDGVPVRQEIEMPERFPRFPLSLRLRNDHIPSLQIDLEIEGLCDPHDHPFPHPMGVHPFSGGYLEGEERIEEYVWRWKGLEEYKETRNDSGRRNTSSKFSPWLALGCLSPRTVYWQVKKFEERFGESKSTYWMIFELMTRDYFRWISASVGKKLFALNGFSGTDANKRSVWNLPRGTVSSKDRTRLQKWIDGMTGAPFVDASMRELKATGFMSNRGRQNVASFLIHDLEFPDWRAGAEYFESQLIDHDVASNWGNWAYLAGVGSDPRGGRKFNVIKQSMDYEPDGWYLTRWCPELLTIPSPMIHQPHLLSAEDLEFFDVKEDDYPRPIVQLPSVPDSLVQKLREMDLEPVFESSPEWAEKIKQDFIDAGAEEVTRTS